MDESIFAVMIRFFEEDSWHFSRVQDETVLRMHVSGKNGQYQCIARAREEAHQLLFYSQFPINVPADKRLKVAEFLTRANYGLYIGNFEMDFQDGEIRYKTSIDVEGAPLSTAIVRNLVAPNLTMIDRYLPGMMALIYANAAPEDAIALVEGGED